MTARIARLPRAPVRARDRAASHHHPKPEPENLASSWTGAGGLDLVVEMAHDLRSPLTSILFLTEALHQGSRGPVSESQRQALGLIYSAALCLCKSASDVVELAREGNPLVEREPVPLSIAEVLQSVHSTILPLAVAKQLDLQLVHPVPEPRLGHPRALSRVLLNLATNAVKFTDAGFVEIAARPLSATRLEFSVRDTGRGLEPASLPDLFQPVRTVPSDGRHHFSSAGLGLAICRKLVRAMGAELQVESAPGQGTRFFFALNLPVATRIAHLAK